MSKRMSAAEQSPTPNDGPTPTVTHYQEVAAQLSQALLAAQRLIPTFAPAHPTTTQFVRKYRSFPDTLLLSAIAAVETSAQLQQTGKFDVGDARDTLQFVEAFRPCVDQLDVLVRDMKFTIAARRATALASALQLYDIAKGIGRDASSADVAAHALNMKRDVWRGRRHHNRTQPEPQPQTT